MGEREWGLDRGLPMFQRDERGRGLSVCAPTQAKWPPAGQAGKGDKVDASALALALSTPSKLSNCGRHLLLSSTQSHLAVRFGAAAVACVSAWELGGQTSHALGHENHG
jgi:hypothetical protein